MAKALTLDQIKDKLENFVPRSVSAQDYEPVRTYVIDTMMTVAAFSEQDPKGISLEPRQFMERVRPLAKHCTIMMQTYGEIPDAATLFSNDSINWSVEKIGGSKETRNNNSRFLSKIGEVLRKVNSDEGLSGSARIVSRPYTREELHKIIRNIPAQSAQARSDNMCVVVALGLAGMTAPTLREVRAVDVSPGAPVTVSARGKTWIVPTMLSEPLLEVLERRQPDNYLLAPNVARDGNTVFYATSKFDYGKGVPRVSLPRLQATWSENLFKRGISRTAFIELTGCNSGSAQARSISFPVDAEALVETAGLLTDFMLLGDDFTRVLTDETIEPFTVIDGGIMS